MEPPQIYDIKLYHEKQSKLLCALHAVNNLLQREQFLTKDFDKIAKELSPSSFFFNNPHKSFFGNYDANVMLVALGKAGLVAQWLDYKGAQRAGAKILESHKQTCHATPASTATNTQIPTNIAQLTTAATVSGLPSTQATDEAPASTSLKSAEADVASGVAAANAHPSTDTLTNTSAGVRTAEELTGTTGSVPGAGEGAADGASVDSAAGAAVSVAVGMSVDRCMWCCTCGCGERLNGLHPCAEMVSPRYVAPPHTASPPTAPPAYTAAPARTPTPDTTSAVPATSAGRTTPSLCPLTALPPALLLLCRVRWDAVRGVIVNVAGGGGFMGSDRHWAAIAKIPVTLSKENSRVMGESAEGGVAGASGGGGNGAGSGNGGGSGDKMPSVATPSLASLSLSTQTLREALHSQQAPDISGHTACPPQVQPQSQAEKQAQNNETAVASSGTSVASSSPSTTASVANVVPAPSAASVSAGTASDALRGTVQLWVNLDSKLDTPRRVRCMASALWRLWQSQPDATVLLVTAEGAHGVIPGRE